MLVAMFALSFSIYGAPVFAQGMTSTNIPPEAFEDGPIEIEISISLVEISDVDYENESYSMNVWITMVSEIDFREIPPPKIDFVNGRIDNIEQEYISEDGHFFRTKMHGTFFAPMDFRNYPILDLRLPLIIEPIKYESHEIKIIEPERVSLLDPDVTMAGLVFVDLQKEFTDITYDDGRVFSRLIATYHFSTPFLAAFMVGIFPILIMGSVVLLSFLLEPRWEIRPEIITATLIAAVFFHVIDIGHGLPPLEYLTLEDKIMTVLYALIVFGMIEIAAQRKYNQGKDEIAVQINKKFRFLIPVVVVGTLGLVWWI